MNHGRTRVNRAELRASLRLREAENFLRDNRARSISGCYVNPNARCPVCKEPVFFYANAAGSRVYFDELGPPWQKHPCTDNPRQRIKDHPPFSGPPTRRTRGITQEIIEAARIAGSFRSSAVTGERWHLMVIVSVKRHGTKNAVVAQLLASDDGEQASFTCHSESPHFEVDDFISKRGQQYSLLDKGTLAPLTFRDGGWVHGLEAQPAASPQATAPPRQIEPPPQPKVTSRTPAPTVVTPKRTYDMTRQEMGHFHSKKKSVQELCDELMPVVRAYAREGDRKPRDVAERLNRDGHRTRLGSRWTPRLTYFLLSLIFLPAEKPLEAGKVADRAQRPRPDSTPVERSGPMTPDEMARRLSKIGRVVLSDDGPERGN